MSNSLPKGIFNAHIYTKNPPKITRSTGAGALTPPAAQQLGDIAVELQKKEAQKVDVPNFVKTVRKEEVELGEAHWDPVTKTVGDKKKRTGTDSELQNMAAKAAASGLKKRKPLGSVRTFTPSSPEQAKADKKSWDDYWEGSWKHIRNEEVELGERHMTSAEKRKEEALGDETASVKASMIKQYGQEKGEQVYYAWKRKKVMGEALVEFGFAEDYDAADNMFDSLSDEFVAVILEEYIEEAKLSRAERRAKNAGRKGYDKEGNPIPTGKPRVRDFDKVIADTDGTNVHIKNAEGERVQSLNDTQYYTHHKNKELKKGHSYDYSDFDSPEVLAKNAKPIKSTIASMKRDQKRNKPVMTLTARSHKVKSGVTDFLNKHGVNASKVKQHFTGDMPSHLNTGERKAITLKHIVKNNPAGAKFTDDHRGNLEAARGVPGVKTFLAKPNKKGKVVSRSYQATKDDFELWVGNLLDEGYDLSEYTWNELSEYFTEAVAIVRADEYFYDFASNKNLKEEVKEIELSPYEYWKENIR
jgi:hypothetical protein